MEEQWNLQIAKAVYELRENAGISPEELARRSRVSIIHFEKASGCGPSLGLSISAVSGGTCPWWQVNGRETSGYMSGQIDFLVEIQPKSL